MLVSEAAKAGGAKGKKMKNPPPALPDSEISFPLRPVGDMKVGWSELVGRRPTQEDALCIR